jgi:hypothetical protein
MSRDAVEANFCSPAGVLEALQIAPLRDAMLEGWIC